MFYRWARHLPDDVMLAPLRLPGREERAADPPYAELSALADDAAHAIASLTHRPYLLVGHSLGGYVALEVTRRLLAVGYPPPAKLVVASCGAPRQGKATDPISHLPDDQFVEEVSRRYDGIPDAIREHPELLAMVLPALRADLRMIEEYDKPSIEPLPVDILAIGGMNDVGVSRSRLAEWRSLTSGRFAMRLFPGGHFFLHLPARREGHLAGDTVPAPLSLVIDSLPAGDEPSP